AAELVISLTRQVADFPTAGIQFKDLTPVFADRRGLAAVTDAIADVASDADLIAGIDARGFLIGGAVAPRLATGGTVAAAHRLLERAGAHVTLAAVVVELAGLGGRELVAPLPVYSVVLL